jgi:tetratricopeptide (TPR) repeat protein
MNRILLFLAVICNNIGQAYHSMKDYSNALAYYEKALEIEQRSLPSTHPTLAVTYSNMATVPADLCRYKEAVEQLERAVTIANHAFGYIHPQVQMYRHYSSDFDEN